MIYVCAGNDLKRKNQFINNFEEVVVLGFNENPLDYATGNNLFGESTTVVVDEFSLSENELEAMKESSTNFILLEDKLNKDLKKKYQKYAEKIEIFEEKIIKERNNSFDIVNAFGRKDKIETWLLYLKAIDSGTSPEAISGMFFWKIKSLMITKSVFPKEELKIFSKNLIDLYHKSHRGEANMVIGLEQFILKSLK
ncbi:MAG: hypothetical protein U9R00_00990 [Patescibacteria group bacterium]|nr:hypothetical protein [Patescibacteria group bacterium]